jgi:hypothetical protein
VGTYTQEDLDQFKIIVKAVEAGERVENGFALHFAMLGWLRQIGRPPGWEVTVFGRQHLD